ncbi:receptor-binding cancer antigen expressed on SiSo cells-like [Amphiura filiformis]|uniref:receptor-binding cancer antigen expressed on SiSo cells-like n=1 Tax=Amphiura filiformis TaxID=82378 RepID=UPI003B21CF71
MQRVWCNVWFICNCIRAVYGFVKKIVFKFQRKKKIDEDLPRTSSVNHSVLPSDSADLEWDDWDDGAPTSIRIEPSNEPLAMQNDMGIPSIQPANAHMHPQTHGHQPQMISTPSVEEEEQDIDYFADMTPKLKKPVLIRKKVDHHRQQVESNNTAGMALSSRLTMNVDPSILPSSELSTWEDDSNSTWEDEAGAIDLSWEAEQVIRETKQADRERRTAEQQRKKMEREAQRATKKDSSKLAVKLK